MYKIRVLLQIFKFSCNFFLFCFFDLLKSITFVTHNLILTQLIKKQELKEL